MPDFVRFSENGIVMQAPQVEDTELRAKVEGHATQADAFLVRAAEVADGINKDSGLSSEGRKARRSEERGKMAGPFGKLIVGTVEHHREAIEVQEAKLMSPEARLAVDDPDSPRTMGAEDAWRGKFRELAAGDPVQRESLRALLVREAQADNRMALRALEMDPTREAFPIVPPEVLNEVRHEHVRTRFPEAAARLDAHRSALAAIEVNAEAASRRLTELLGSAPVEGSGVSARKAS